MPTILHLGGPGSLNGLELQVTSQQAPIHLSLYLHSTGMASVSRDTQIEVSDPLQSKHFTDSAGSFVDLTQTRVTWEEGTAHCGQCHP